MPTLVQHVQKRASEKERVLFLELGPPSLFPLLPGAWQKKKVPFFFFFGKWISSGFHSTCQRAFWLRAPPIRILIKLTFVLIPPSPIITSPTMIARSFTRSLLRAAPRMPSTSTAAVARVALPRFTAVQAARTFSSTLSTRGQGEGDAELSAKLAQELSYEQENSNLFIGDSPTNEPGFVTEFKQAGVWKISDKPGFDEVALDRDFGNEHITVLFSVGDIDTSGPLEENEDGSPAEMDGPPEQPENPPFPVRISATITKPSGGALMLDGFVQDGEVNVDNIAFYKTKELATRMDAEIDFQRRGFYLGPQFETLDDNLQGQFMQFLLERGIDTNMALFIPNYAEYKEQREYCGWLSNVQKFIDV